MKKINSVLISEIFNGLKNKESEILDVYHSGENWVGKATKIIKTVITEIGKQKSLYVATHGCENADEGEWLLDLTFHDIKYDGDSSKIKSIPLVVESEFSKPSYTGFKEDFDKLFIATSSERLFIMRINNQQELEKIVKYGEESVQLFEPFKQVILFILFIGMK
jgi:hypothetical protein